MTGSTARIWLLADQHQEAIATVKTILEGRGAAVEVLNLTNAMERVVRDRGGRLLDNLKGVFAQVRGSGEGSEEEEKVLQEALDRGTPDMIVVSSARYLSSLEVLARGVGGDALRVALLPNYNLSSAWLKSSMHAYVVPHETLRAPLLEAGIDSKAVMVGGPAISAQYAVVPHADTLKQEYGLSEEEGSVVLILCEGFDHSELDRIAFQLSLVQQEMTPIFAVGDDEDAAEVLRRAARTHGLLANLLGPRDDFQNFVAISDLIISNPNHELVVESLALDKPLFLLGDSGPVTTQTDFLVARGVARNSTEILKLASELEFTLRGSKLSQMEEASRKVGHSTGSAEVADAIMKIYESREELRGGGEEERFVGPFERIGARKTPSVNPKNKIISPFESVGKGKKLAPTEPRVRVEERVKGTSPLSAAEAKDELASLIMMERDLERRIATSKRDEEQWRNRLELAREWNEGDLATEAEQRLRGILEEGEKLREDLEKVTVQKNMIKERVRGGKLPAREAGAEPNTSPKAGSEGRFRDMEVEDDLAALRKRLEEDLED